MFRGALGELYSRGPEISFITWGGDVVQYTAEGGRDFLALFSPMSCQDAGVLSPIFFSFLLVPAADLGKNSQEDYVWLLGSRLKCCNHQRRGSLASVGDAR